MKRIYPYIGIIFGILAVATCICFSGDKKVFAKVDSNTTRYTPAQLNRMLDNQEKDENSRHLAVMSMINGQRQLIELFADTTIGLKNK